MNFDTETKIAKIERPIAVQVINAANVGVAKRDADEDGNMEDGQDHENKFDTRYLDPSLVKEKKKANKEAARLMKLSLTDGLNHFDAIEFERLKNIDSFNIGQKFLLTPPIEVRRGILFLTNTNVSYLGKPLQPPTPQVVPQL